jgi:tRNA modification GTPase
VQPGTGTETETIAALATPAGRGAIAIVRLSGPHARAIGAAVAPTARPLAPRVATLARIVGSDGAPLDEALVLYFPGPNSYTGEDVVELHVHGSPAVVRETLAAALAAGARLAGPGEFTRRAFLAGKLDLSAAEAVADLIASEHRGAARAALARLSGGLAGEVEALRARLNGLLEELSAALDFPDEVEAPARSELASRLAELRARLAQLADGWERGRLVREGVSVALVGPPNAGKSSLLNALLGTDRALVSELAGTTRDTLEETLALDGFVARLIDTAGLRASAEPLESAGVARAEAALAQSRIALVVIDGSQPLAPEALDVLTRTRGTERIVYFNKSDRGRAGYEQRAAPERDALFGNVYDPATLAAIRSALRELATGGEAFDPAHPHLGTARQADAVLAAQRALDAAAETLASGAPVDLLCGDLLAASAALGGVSGAVASDEVLDAIFARFCIGK